MFFIPRSPELMIKKKLFSFPITLPCCILRWLEVRKSPLLFETERRKYRG